MYKTKPQMGWFTGWKQEIWEYFTSRVELFFFAVVTIQILHFIHFIANTMKTQKNEIQGERELLGFMLRIS